MPSRNVRELVLGPLDPAEPLQVGLELVGEVEQVADVLKCVAQAGLRTAATPPVGPGLAPEQRDFQGLVDQISQGKRIAEADEPGGDLDVEDSAGGPDAGLHPADPQVLARRVHDDLE